MGLFSKIGESIKTAADNVSNEIKKRQEIQRAKETALEKFEMNDLKEICKAYGVAEPEPWYVEPITGNKSPRTITRKDFIKRITDGLSIEQIKEFATRRKLKVSTEKTIQKEISKTPIQEEKPTGNASVGKLDDILKMIEAEFPRPKGIQKEKDFERLLAQFLQIKLPGHLIETQITVANKVKVDIVIDKEYALELKIAKSIDVLRHLHGQIIDYRKSFEKIAIILINPPRAISDEELEGYKRGYEKEGVKVLIISCNIQHQAKTKMILTKVRR